MSSILESLKKSQQQRPTTGNPAGGWRFAASHKPAKSQWPRLLALIVILAGLLGWGFSDELKQAWQALAGKKTQTYRQDQAAAQSTARPAVATNTISTRSVTQQNTPHRDKQNSLPRPDPATARQQLAERMASTNGPEKQAAARAATKRPSLPTGTPPAQQAGNLPPNPQQTIQQQTGTAPAATTAKTPPAGSTRQKYRHQYQLPFAIRRNLPQLTLSIHVWDQNPKHRLVVINGEDLGIGDALPDSEVTVKDIVPEGAVLNVGGEVFLLPRQR